MTFGRRAARRRPRTLAGLLLLAALLIVPRVVALDADTLPSLDINSGIWTDEGFYTYNARNAVVFGRAELDEFNNRNLSPVLDLVQRLVFRAFGVGLVPARAVSVACAFVALGFFYAALRRAFGRRVALSGLILLGGEVTFILYNRLALMETPALVVLCAALWAFTLGTPAGWLLSGALAASAIAFKTTFLVFLPAPLLAWAWRWGASRQRVGRPVLWYATGALVGTAIYLLAWGIPHGPEIWRMNNYYRTRQVQPRSIHQAARFVQRAAFGYRRGLAQFLETRSPVLSTLAVLGLLAIPLGRRPVKKAEGLKSLARSATVLPDGKTGRPFVPGTVREDGRFTERGISIPRQLREDAHRVLWLWAVLGLGALAVSRYSPTRYYLIVYPALAALASLALWRLVPLWRWARRRRGRLANAPLLCLPAFLLAYHLLLPALYHLPAARAHFGLLDEALAALAAGGLTYGLVLRRARSLPRPGPLAARVLGLFLVVSLGQQAFWFVTRDYRTRDVAREISQIVCRSGDVLAGDWAPNLCLDNRVRAVAVLPGLANGRRPVETLHADYVLVAQTPYPIRWWKRQAPGVVAPQNLVRRFRFHEYTLHLYRVPAAAAGTKGSAARRAAATHPAKAAG